MPKRKGKMSKKEAKDKKQAKAKMRAKAKKEVRQKQPVQVKLEPDECTFTYRDGEKEAEAERNASGYKVMSVSEYVRSVRPELVPDIKPKIEPVVKEESYDSDPDPELGNHKEKTFKCDFCDKLFGKNYLLNRHKEIHSLTRKKYPCDICQKQFKLKKSLRTHKVIHDLSRKMFECRICEKKFMFARYLKYHIQSKHENNKEKKNCTYCDRKFVSNQNLFRHIRSEHFNLLRQQDKLTGDLHPIFQGVRTYECYRCKLPSSLIVLKKHLLTCNGARRVVVPSVKCKLCTGQFTSKCSFKKHMRNIHLIDLSKEAMKTVPAEKTHKCTFCDRSFSASKQKIFHIRNKHFSLLRKQDKYTGDLHPIFQGIRTYECYRCKILKNCATKVKKHMQTCTGERRVVIQTIQCELCISRFAYKSSLRRHMQEFHSIHLSSEAMKNVRVEKTHKCSFCDKSFSVSRQMIYHNRTKHFSLLRKEDKLTGDLHPIFQGIRSYECYRCQFSQISSNSIRAHMKCCNNRNIECKLCNKRFKNINSIKTHLVRIHSMSYSKYKQMGKGANVEETERTFECIDCKAYFTTKEGLKQHVMFYCRKRGFKCDYCSQKFLQQNDKIDHHRHVHPTMFKTSHGQNFECHICRACMPVQTALKHLAEQHQRKTHLKLNICRLKVPE